MFQIPRLERHVDGGICVSHWGRIGSLLLRAGDRLIVGRQSDSDLLVLVPRGRGRPMLGRFGDRGLIAEPGGVPASERRWQVAGALVAVERCLERNGLDIEGGTAVVRIDGESLADVARARAVFAGGTLSADEISELCNQAAVAPERHGVRVAIAVGSDLAGAEAMLADVSAGFIRRQVTVNSHEAHGRGVVVAGPWLQAVVQPDVVVRESAAGPEQLGLFGGSRKTG